MATDTIKYKPFILTVTAMIVALSVAVIFGWLLNVRILQSMIIDYPAMKFNTALGFIFAAMAVFIQVYKPNKSLIKLSQLFSLTVFVIGILSFLEELFKINIGIDQLFITDHEFISLGKPFPGRMSPVSAICFTLMGASLFMTSIESSWLKKLAQVFFHAVTTLAFIAIMGYLFQLPSLYKLSYLTSMAVNTSLFFFVLSIAASLINSNLGITGLFIGTDIGNAMARKLFLRMAVSILILSYIRILTHRFFLVSVEFGVVVFALSFILVSLFLILRTARALNLMNSEKSEAESNLNRIRTFLNATPDPIVVADAKGIILVANNQIENVFGYTKEEVIGQKIEILMPERYRSKHGGHVHGFFGSPKTREMGSGLELFAQKKGGIEFPVEISLSPIKLEDGMYVSAAIRDVTQRKLVELELKESHERNKIFIQQSPNAIAMFNKEMRYMAASEKWLKDYGLVGREIIGQSHYEVFPEIGDDWKIKHQNCLKGEINKCDEFPFERADGTTQWISWDVRPWYVAEDTVGGLLMQTADITHLKEKDFEKRRVEDILDKTNEVARIGTWELDLEIGKPIWSRVTKEIHEVPPDYLPDLSTAINFFKEGESRKKIEKAITAAIEHGTPYDLEVELISAKGNSVWSRAIGQAEFKDGTCKRLYGVFQDISKVKRAEAELNKFNSELETIFDAGNVSIISTTTEGIITHFNKGAEIMLQYTSEEVVDIQTPAILHLEEEAIKRSQELTQLYGRPIEGFDTFIELAKQGQHESREWTYVRKDGSTFPVLLIVNALRNDANEITGYLGIGTDITERVENQKKIIEAKRNLEELSDRLMQQNKQLASFAQITSHNLRSPVSNLTSLVHLYKTSKTKEDKDLMFEKFETVVEHLSTTLNSLIDSIQIKEDVNKKLEIVKFEEILKKTKEMVMAQLSLTGAEITADFSEVQQIEYHKIYMESIFLNFITNSIKYRSPDRKPKIKIETKLIDNKVVLRVRDNGLGIDLKRHGHKLFGLHKTFHRNREARGIGLFITKAQVEAMGGTITAESEVDNGTAFKIEFNKTKNHD